MLFFFDKNTNQKQLWKREVGEERFYAYIWSQNNSHFSVQ